MSIVKYFLVIVTFALLQSSFFPQFQIMQTRPDLILLFVISIGLLKGSREGAVTGAGAGIIAGIISWNVWGLYFLVYSLAGFFAGFIPEKVEPDIFIVPLLSGLVGSVGMALIFSVLGPSLDLFYPTGDDLIRTLIFTGWNGFFSIPVFWVSRYVLISPDATWSLK